MTAQIRLVGENVAPELRDLASWLRREDEFRGRVVVEQQPVQPGNMGALSDMLVVAVGSGGLSTALATSLALWIKHRKPKADIEITRSKGLSVKIALRDLSEDELAKVLLKALED